MKYYLKHIKACCGWYIETEYHNCNHPANEDEYCSADCPILDYLDKLKRGIIEDND